MSERLNLQEPKTGFNNNSYLSISVSLQGLNTLFQHTIVEERIAKELRRIATKNCVQTRDFIQSEGLGATGSMILQWFIDFYHNHEIYFFLITKIPGLIKVIRFILEISINCIYWVKNKKYELTMKEFSNPTMTIYLSWKVDCHGDNEFINVHTLKSAYIESLILVRQFEAQVAKSCPDIKYIINQKFKSLNTGKILYIRDLGSSGRATNRLKTFKPEDNTYMVYSKRTIIPGISRLVYEKNYIDYADSFGFD